MCQLARLKHDSKLGKHNISNHCVLKQSKCCITKQVSISKNTYKPTKYTSNNQYQVPNFYSLFIIVTFIFSYSILCEKHPSMVANRRMDFKNDSNGSKDKTEFVGILSALDGNSLHQATGEKDKIVTSSGKRPVNLSPTKLLFEVENTGELSQPHDEEDEDDDFYIKNPIDTRTPDFDVESELKLNDSDFNDFDDNKTYDMHSFSPTVAGNKEILIKIKPERPFKSDMHHSEPFLKHITPSSNHHHQGNISDTIKGFLEGKSERPGLLGGIAQESSSSNSLPQCILPLRSGICLTYDMIEWAIERARNVLRFQAPSPQELETIELSEVTINAVGELNELTTRILTQNLQLDWQEITFGLEQIDVSRTSLWEVCPAVFRSPPSCQILTRYRTHSGHCNNPIAGHLGSSNMPFVRILPADYADGVGTPRCSSFSGAQLPPARLVALSLHPDIDNVNALHSVLYMAWGQLLNHDLSLASGARGKFEIKFVADQKRCTKKRLSQSFFII